MLKPTRNGRAPRDSVIRGELERDESMTIFGPAFCDRSGDGEFLKWQNKKEIWGLKEHLADMGMKVADLMKEVFTGVVDSLKPAKPKPKSKSTRALRP